MILVVFFVDDWVVQVSTLVLSNLAMLPGVVYCYYCELHLLMTALGLASLSSAFYHLCDTDTYCIADLSFSALQVRQRGYIRISSPLCAL